MICGTGALGPGNCAVVHPPLASLEWNCFGSFECSDRGRSSSGVGDFLICGTWSSEDVDGPSGGRILLPGLEKFSAGSDIEDAAVTGSVLTREIPGTGSSGPIVGDCAGESSASAFRPTARLDVGALSPFRRLPRLYAVCLERFSPPASPGMIGMSSAGATPIAESWLLLILSMLIFLIRLVGSLTRVSSSARLAALLGSWCPLSDRLRSSLSAPSSYPLSLLICRESMLFFLFIPPEFCRSKPSGASCCPSSDNLFIFSTLSSMNVLNSFGASSGCNRAGTQNSLEGSSSSESCEGGRAGIPKPGPKEGRSGSAVSTFIDMRRMA